MSVCGYCGVQYGDSHACWSYFNTLLDKNKPTTIGSPEWRKQRPVFSGFLWYFPDAILEAAYCSYIGNQQHNPGQPLHWAKEKSMDEEDALIRHLMKRGTLDTDGVRHSAKVFWRAGAMCQREIESERSK